jgi:hypothetical protein
MEEVPSRTTSIKGPETHSQNNEIPPTSVLPPDTPPQSQTLSSSHRKTGRPPAPSRRGRVIRNQYTKESSNVPEDVDTTSPAARSVSRDRHNTIEEYPVTNGYSQAEISGEASSSKPSKPRQMHPLRTSMNEMKKRVASILEFISKTQVEMAGTSTPPHGSTGGNSSGGVAPPSLLRTTANGEVEKGDEKTDKGFVELNSLEMMDVLTRELVLWQKGYGKYGEK